MRKKHLISEEIDEACSYSASFDGFNQFDTLVDIERKIELVRIRRESYDTVVNLNSQKLKGFIISKLQA